MFSDEVNYFCSRCGDIVLLDSNVLILLVVGLTNLDYIKKVKATKLFSEDHFLMLQWIVDDNFDKVLTTPSILTEVSNLAGQKKKYEKELFFKEELFENFKNWISTAIEEFSESEEVSNDRSFNRLGLTDAAILKISEERAGVITMDLHLRLELERRDIPVLNFSNLVGVPYPFY